MNTSKLNATLKTYSIFEKADRFVFMNAANIHIELDKETGEFLDGNVCDCAHLEPLFRGLFNLALSKSK